MNSFGIMFAAAAALAATVGIVIPANASQDNPQRIEKADVSGLRDFDFLVGDWRVRHKRLKERLANSREWQEFDGTCSNRRLMDGWGNVDDNVINLPGDAYRGIGLRSYDPKTAQWAIWWVDSRTPHGALDPPVKGGFVNGVGTFYSDDTLRGKPIRVRFTWSKITPTSAHWEQAFSPDGGKTWEVNWVMEFQRVS
jgi:hypothetical protein